ncbi:LOB domain-containing protein 30-like [Eucalyptus grandis]|uniref:LOB domain-containing protein 30-like n=1 Tax=Eucalyptus grandis TaxID=71139 RepID=UPI00052596E9|nr:LOB domain-containing protein 30-like [Eucalyptus grandis]
MSSNPSSSASASGEIASTAGGGSGGPCGACKFLRRKCITGCVFAPYFDSEQGAAHFAAVHRVFGASNASKLLLNIPAHRRQDAVVAICYEAQARLRDPVYGCVAHIFALQQQVVNLQAELSYLQAHLGPLELPTQPLPPLLPMQLPVAPHSLSIADLPIPSASPSMPAQYDVSSLFDPTVHPSSWAAGTLLRRTIDPRQFSGGCSLPTTMVEGEGDLRALTSEFLSTQCPPRMPDTSPTPCPSKKDKP